MIYETKFNEIKHITIEMGGNNIILNNVVIMSTDEDDCLVSLTGSDETVRSLYINKINDGLNIGIPQDNSYNYFCDCMDSKCNSAALRDIMENIDIIIKIRNLQTLTIYDAGVANRKFLVKIPVEYLSIESTGSSLFEIEDVKKAKLFISGNSYIILKKISSDLVGCITGSGNIDIHNGNPEFINISISGSGNVNANIMVQKAQLSISGSGSIMVEQVIEECVEQQTGTGNIVVKKEDNLFLHCEKFGKRKDRI